MQVILIYDDATSEAFLAGNMKLVAFDRDVARFRGPWARGETLLQPAARRIACQKIQRGQTVQTETGKWKRVVESRHH